MKNVPCLLTEHEIDGLIDYNAVLKCLTTSFLGLTTGTSIQPIEVRTEFPNDRGDCIFYPALVWDLGLVGVATSPYIIKRLEQGLSPVTAYTLLLSTETGEPVLFCNSKHLTTIRTAATTLLAAKLLLSGDDYKLTIVGAGAIGLEHAKFAASSNKFSNISIVSPSVCDPTSPNHKSRISDICALGGIAEPGENIEESVKNADVVMLCTDSAEPVVKEHWIHNATLLTSISTNSPLAHEIDPTWLNKMNVFCDYRTTASRTAGEFILAENNHGWSPKQIAGDIPELLIHQLNQNSGEHSQGHLLANIPSNREGLLYFRSTGLGIEDIAVAGALLEALH